MSIIKEIQPQTIGFRQQKDAEVGTISILRFSDKQELTMPDLAELFTEAAKDWRMGKLPKVTIKNDRIEIEGSPRRAPNDYVTIKANQIGAQG